MLTQFLLSVLYTLLLYAVFIYVLTHTVRIIKKMIGKDLPGNDDADKDHNHSEQSSESLTDKSTHNER